MLQLPNWMDFHADSRPADLAIVTPRVSLTFAQMRQTSVAAALKLEENGIKRGQRVAVHVVNPALQLSLLLALHRLGVTVCLLPQELSRRQSALDTVTFDRMLTDKEENLGGVEELRTDLDWLVELPAGVATTRGGFSKPDDVSLISMTSGTTSASKPMAFTVEQLETRLILRSFGDQASTRGEKTIILATLTSMNGFQSCLGAFWGGGTVYMGWNADNVLEAIATHRIEKLFCSSPLLMKALETLEKEPLDLSSLRQIYAGGDSLPPVLARRVAEKMCSNLLGGFSTNEAGKLSMAPVEHMGFRAQQVGFLFPWAEAQAVDEQDRVLPQGQEGHLRFKTPYMISGYLDNPQATAARFKDGWFYSDDIGWVTPDRRLVITGRSADFVNSHSGRFNPVHIDHALAGHPKILEAAGFGARGVDDKDEIWLAVVARTAIEDSELRQFCSEKLGSQAPQHFLRLKKLPRNDGGKIMRRKLAEMVAKERPETKA